LPDLPVSLAYLPASLPVWQPGLSFAFEDRIPQPFGQQVVDAKFLVLLTCSPILHSLLACDLFPSKSPVVTRLLLPICHVDWSLVVLTDVAMRPYFRIIPPAADDCLLTFSPAHPSPPTDYALYMSVADSSIAVHRRRAITFRLPLPAFSPVLKH